MRIWNGSFGITTMKSKPDITKSQGECLLKMHPNSSSGSTEFMVLLSPGEEISSGIRGDFYSEDASGFTGQ